MANVISSVYQLHKLIFPLPKKSWMLSFVLNGGLSVRSLYNPLLCPLCLYLVRPWRGWDDLLCSASHWRQIFCITESCASSAAWRTSWTNGPARLVSSFTASRYAGLSLLHIRKALICRKTSDEIKRELPQKLYSLRSKDANKGKKAK